MEPTTYKSMADRIRNSRTLESLERCYWLMDELYYHGLITVAQLSRLDSIYVDTSAKLQPERFGSL